MPKLDNNNTGHFGFSAVKLDELDSTEYTLVTLVLDRSGSTSGFQTEMESCVKTILEACKKSPRAENLMLRVVTFESGHREEHGFKLLRHCNPDDYDGILRPGGMTALVDASINGIEATLNHAKNLVDNDFDVNGIVFIMTDGWENSSSLSVSNLNKSITDVRFQEQLEGLTTVLIGINTSSGGIQDALDDFKNDAGLDEYIDIQNADSGSLAKLAQFVGSSITSKSTSLATGAPVSLTF